MGFSAPPLQLLIFLLTVTFASLSCIGKASKLSLLHIRQPSLQLSDTTGSLYWKVIRSRLRGEAQEEEKDWLEALHQLEREIQEPPNLGREKLEGPLGMLDKSGLLEGEEEEEEKEEEEEREERHPADELLQRLQADATISYILGGSLYWKEIRSRLKGEAQEKEKDLLEALHQLEREVQEPSNLETEKLEGPVGILDKSGLSEREEEEKEEEREERHPADELLQRLHADATISYILGGY